jgi:iron complex transport system substrate-binding protein
MLRKIIFITILVALTLAACAPAIPATKAVGLTLTDGLGRTVTLASPAQRVVSLAPSNTEILFAIGAGDQVVGRDEFSDYPAEAKAIQSVGGSMGGYSLEAIAALKPETWTDGVLSFQPEIVRGVVHQP